MSEEQTISPKAPSLFRNYISFVGGAIAFASLVCIVLLVLLDVVGDTDSPYLGILTYILIPSVLVFGLVLAVVGVVLERRRRRKLAPGEIAEYPQLDLN